MREPLYRRTFDAATLLRERPPRIRHPHKAALLEIAYPGRQVASGQIEVTRWAQHVPETVSLDATPTAEVCPNFYDYRSIEGTTAVEWHVNFADPQLFVAYGSRLFAQDEMQVAEHPLLACVREALLDEGLLAETTDGPVATPILVGNVERRIHVQTNADPAAGRPRGLYGNLFADASLDVVRRATRRVEPPTHSNIIAMAAPSGGYGEYTEEEIRYIFSTAYTAFAATVQESRRMHGNAARIAVHSGFWGCGAFGGNRTLMVAIQSLAARAAHINHVVLHAGDESGAEEARSGLEVAEGLALRCGTTCSLEKIVDRTVLLAYCWGFSDGN